METNGSGQRYGWDDSHLIEKMRGYGFNICSYDPFTRRLNAAPSGNGNTIFVRDIAMMQERVKEAPHFQLVNGQIWTRDGYHRIFCSAFASRAAVHLVHGVIYHPRPDIIFPIFCLVRLEESTNSSSAY